MNSRHNDGVIRMVTAPFTASTSALEPNGSSSSDALAALRESVSIARSAKSSDDPQRRSFVWISLDTATNAEIDQVADIVGLDDLLLEDALSPQQRAKIEARPDELFVLLKSLSWFGETSDVETGQIAVFVGHGYVITRLSGSPFDTDAIRQRLVENADLRTAGPISVAWAIADLAVDGYLVVGESIESEIEQIEDALFAEIPSELASRIYRLNRENIEMRRAVRPLLPLAIRLTQGTQDGVPQALQPFFRDIGDHLLRANDMVDAFDTALMTMLMASTARQDLQQNRDMRKIAAWAAIIAVPTAIAGIYGMNFDEMPELHWTFGYPMVLVVMAVICFVLYRAFRRSDWI